MAEKTKEENEAVGAPATEPSPRLRLLQKILAMRCDIEPLAKDNFNQYDKYQYLSHPKILEAVKKQQKDKNVLFYVEYAPQHSTGNRMGFESVFVDMDTEYELRHPYAFTPCMGQREAIKGDGATWTYAEKYITRIEFGIQAEDDPDAMPQQTGATVQSKQQTPAPPKQQTPPPPPSNTAQASRPSVVKYGNAMYGASNIEAAGQKLDNGEITSNNIIASAHFVFSVAKKLYACMSEMPDAVKKTVENYMEACVKHGVMDAPSKPDYKEKITKQGQERIEEIIDFYNNFSRK